MQIKMNALEILGKSDIIKLQKRINRIIDENDWEWFPIVDVVVIKRKKRHSERRYFFHVEEIKIQRYGDEAPSMDESGIDGQHCEIHRITRPQLEEYFRRGTLPQSNNPTLEP